MFKKVLISLLLLALIPGIQAQEMTEGFQNLEKGEFAKAEVFFNKILEDFPENKTARLCYARALGLNTDPLQAKSLFEELLIEYPNDLEVQLNFAESLLWNKDFGTAENYYFNMLKSDPGNFAILLGYANTLSNLKQYEKALETINKALSIEPDNASAKISRKYILLGYASVLTSKKEYELALDFLNRNLEDFPNDRETLLNKANIYLIQKNAEEAIQVYSLLKENVEDSITGLNGIALAHHISGNEKSALKFAKFAKEKSEKAKNDEVRYNAVERYVQALIWNSKYKKAQVLIDSLKKSHPLNNRVLALDATLGMYTADFKKSISNYSQILKNEPSSFDGNLGIANAYFAWGNVELAREAAQKTLHHYPDQPDAEGFLKKIQNESRPAVGESFSYSFDNGNNAAYTSNTQVVFPVNLKFKLNVNYAYRETENSVSLEKATSNQLQVKGSYRVLPALSVNFKGGLLKANSAQTNFSSFVGEISTKIKPLVRDHLEIGYRRDVQDFNADLLSRKIAGDHIFLNNNYSTTYGLGWYLQYINTHQNDKNQRNLLFTSLYYNILKKPGLKTGLNYQFIGFKEQLPEVYFSPEKFMAAEVFLGLSSQNPRSKLNYDLTAATGYQFIEDLKKQSTYRLNGNIRYKIGQNLQTGIHANHSNIASATVAGFTYTEFSTIIKYSF